MKKMIKKICSLLLATAMVFSNIGTTAFAETETVTEADLITKTNPILKSYDISDANGTWVMSSSTRFVVEATDENLANDRLAEVIRLMNAEFVEKQIASTTEHAMVYVAEGQQEAQDILVRVVPVEDITTETTSEEAYKITISESGVVVEAASENAVIYALRTIQTLMITNDGLVYGEILDYPDVEERRLHVDCARKYISKDWFIRQIREMSYLKMNTIQIHFSENLGFRIECETDPAIMSDQYLTKAEVREILAEAKLYGVKVIPSFDSPGHVDQILRAHPEFGQVSSSGRHYASGLDVTNPEAVEYIYSLYDEYMELFEGCTDFHIGGDEYMEFDRAPFTTEYKSVLNAYAQETLGEGYIWKDVMANYINELAAYVYSKGFKPRIFNDGIYYGENSYEGAQKIEMHDYIGIDFWSQMSWNSSIARLQTFIDKGHTDIYNFNASFFYYVLRTSKPTDGREQHSFDVLNQDANIYNNWTPGKFQSNTISDDAEQIKGASIGIWCDAPNICDEDTITNDIASELRSLACKSWNTSANDLLPYEEFVTLTEEIGNVAGYTKGSELPEVGNFIASGDLGTLTLRYVDEAGNEIKASTNKYGVIGDAYTIEEAAIYGYRFVSMDGASSGIFAEEDIVVTLTYELYTDKSELQAMIADENLEENYIPKTFVDYKTALAAAKEVLADDTAHQSHVDEAVAALEAAEEKLVPMSRLELYLEVISPKANAGYTSATYTAYQTAVTAGETVLYDQSASDADVIAALQEIKTTKAALAVASGSDITVTANKGVYQTYYLSNILDGNTNTYAWIDGAQTTGDYLLFTFNTPVILNTFNLVYPTNVGGDYFQHADVEISRDGEEWTKIGEAGSSEGITANANGVVTQYLRIHVTQTIDNWTQIAEATFDYEEIAAADTTELQSAVDEILVMDLSAYTSESVNVLVEALEAATAVLNGNGVSQAEVNAALAEVEDARLYLIEKDAELENPFEDVYESDYYYAPVMWAVEKGITDGWTDTTFAPDMGCTRGQVVTFLWRAAGEPEATNAENPFTDVAEGTYYYDAILWAVEKEITDGWTDTTFAPDMTCTRGQIVTFIWRAAGEPEAKDAENPFEDVAENAYYYDAVLWAVEEGITDGWTDTTFAPEMDCTRGQIVTFLHRYHN